MWPAGALWLARTDRRFLRYSQSSGQSPTRPIAGALSAAGRDPRICQPGPKTEVAGWYDAHSAFALGLAFGAIQLAGVRDCFDRIQEEELEQAEFAPKASPKANRRMVRSYQPATSVWDPADRFRWIAASSR